MKFAGDQQAVRSIGGGAGLKELRRRLKKACRGSDFAVRLASDDFLLCCPEATLAKSDVLNRLGVPEIACSGRKVNLAYTTGWVAHIKLATCPPIC